VFGDYYDHIRDISFIIILYILIIKKINDDNSSNSSHKLINTILFITINIFFVISLIPLSCVEKEIHKKDSMQLIFFLCKYNKYLSPIMREIFCLGNYFILLCLFILSLSITNTHN